MLPMWLLRTLLRLPMSQTALPVPTEPQPAEVLTVTLDHVGPIELSVLSGSLYSLAAQHLRFADRIGATINGDQVKLYVREIRSGSIIVELIAMAQTAGTIAGAMNTVVSFAKNIHGLLSFGTGAATAPPPKTTPSDARDLSQFIEPAASNPDALMKLEVSGGAQVNIGTLIINSNQANATQNRLRNWAARQELPVNGTHSAQLFYMERATGNPASTTGDRGIIERFSRKSVKTRFANLENKQRMVDEALFRKVYVVDVDVQTVEGQPRLYTILRVLDTMERDE